MVTATSVMEKYRKFGNRAKEARAETSGWKPEKGRYVCSLDDILITDSKFTWKNPKPGGEVAAMGVQFCFTMRDDPTNPNVSWRDFRVDHPDVSVEELAALLGTPQPPSDQQKATNQGEGQWLKIRMQDGQFKGQIGTLAGLDPDTIDLLAELALIQQDIETRRSAGTAPIFVEVQVYDQDGWDREKQQKDPKTRRFDRAKILRIVTV